MPCDMAMHQPCAGVIDLERDPDVPANCAVHCISARGVIQVGDDVGGEFAVTLGQDDKVVAVQMNGMNGARDGARRVVDVWVHGEVSLDHEVDPFARFVVQVNWGCFFC